jgi:hypothetical protein
MKKHPANSKTITVGNRTWAQLLVESTGVSTDIPASAKSVRQICADLRAAGLPDGQSAVSRFAERAVKEGRAKMYRKIENGKWTRFYDITQ